MPLFASADAGFLFAAFGGGVLAVLLGTLIFYLKAALRWLLRPDTSVQRIMSAQRQLECASFGSSPGRWPCNTYPDCQPAVGRGRQVMETRGSKIDGGPGCSNARPRSPASAYMYSTGAAVEEQQVSAAGSAGPTHFGDLSARPTSSRAQVPRPQPRRGSVVSDINPDVARSPHDVPQLQHPWDALDSGPSSGRDSGMGRQAYGRAYSRAGSAADLIESSVMAVPQGGGAADVRGQGPSRARGHTSGSRQATMRTPAPHETALVPHDAQHNPNSVEGARVKHRPGGQQPPQPGQAIGDAKPIGAPDPAISTGGRMRGRRWGVACSEATDLSTYYGGPSASEPTAATQRHSFPGWGPGPARLTLDQAARGWAQDCALERPQGPPQQQQQTDRTPALTAPESYGRLMAAISEVSAEGRTVHGRPGAAGEEERGVTAAAATGSQVDPCVAACGDPSQQDGDPGGFQGMPVSYVQGGAKARETTPAHVVVQEGVGTLALAAADEPVLEAVALPEIRPDVGPGKLPQQLQPAAAGTLAAPESAPSAPWRISNRDMTSFASGGAGASATPARVAAAGRGFGSRRVGAAFTSGRCSLDMLSPAGTFAAGALAAAPAGPGTSVDIDSPVARSSVLYGSPLRHVSVSMKLAAPPGAQYRHLEAALMAMAHRSIEAVLNNPSGRSGDVAAPVGLNSDGGRMRYDSQANIGMGGGEGEGEGGGNGDTSSVDIAGGSGGGGDGGGGGNAGSRHRVRWRGYSAQVECLPGCIQLILRVQYESDVVLDDVALAADLEVLQQELLRQLAAGDSAPAAGGAPGREGAGPSTSGPIGAPAQEYPVFWVPSNPAASPCAPGQPGPLAAIYSVAGPAGQGSGARGDPAGATAAILRHAPGARHATRAAPVVVYIHPPVLPSTPATGSLSDAVRSDDLLILRTARPDGSDGGSAAAANLAIDCVSSSVGAPGNGSGGWLGRLGKVANHTQPYVRQNSAERSTVLPSPPNQHRTSHNRMGTSGQGRAFDVQVGEWGGSWTVSQSSQSNTMAGGGHSSASEALWSPFRSPLTMSLRQSSEAPVESDAVAPSSFRAPPLSAVQPEHAATSLPWYRNGRGGSGASGRGNDASAAAAAKAEGTRDGDTMRSGRRRHTNRALTWDACHFKDRCMVAGAASDPVGERPNPRRLREMHRDDSFHTVGDSASDFAHSMADLTARQEDEHHHQHKYHQGDTDVTEHQEGKSCQQQQQQEQQQQEQEQHGSKVLERRLDEPVDIEWFSLCSNVGGRNPPKPASNDGEPGLDCTSASPFDESAAPADAFDKDFGAGFYGTSRSHDAMPPAPPMAAATGMVVDRFTDPHRPLHAPHTPASAACTPPNTLRQSLTPSPPPSALPAPKIPSSRGVAQQAHQLVSSWPVPPLGNTALGSGSQCGVTRIVRIAIFIDESDVGIYHHTAEAAAGGSSVRDAATGLHVPVRSSMDVRLVVKQHGSVVAEVERLTVGPRGASVRLDLSELEEGSAAVLVLPCRGQHAQQGLRSAEGAIGTEGSKAAEEKVMAQAALSYIPIAVVPPVVASELCGLMRGMEEAAEAATAAVSSCPINNPRVVRARAFTHHFSALISDIVSLLLGCERLAEEAEQQVATGKKCDSDCVAEENTHLADLQTLGASIVSYLTQMGLRCTMQYLLEEIQAAGVQVRGADQEVEEKVQENFNTGELNGRGVAALEIEGVVEKGDSTHPSTTCAAEEPTQGSLGIFDRNQLFTPVASGPGAGASARHASHFKLSLCTAAEVRGGGEVNGSGEVSGEVSGSGKASASSEVSGRGEASGSGEGSGERHCVQTSPGARSLAPAAALWSSVFRGFDPPTEARFEGYLCEQASNISRAMMTSAAAITAAVTFRCLGAPYYGVLLWTWSSAMHFRTDGLRGGNGNGDGADVPAGMGGCGGTGIGCGCVSDDNDGAIAPRPWASGGLHAGIRWLCWAWGLSLALPAAVLGLTTWLQHDVAFSGLRRREIVVLCIHVVAMALLCAYGRCAADASGVAPPVLSLAAALLVVLQPASCSVRFHSYRIWWVLDAVLLLSLIGPLGRSASSPVPGSWSVLQSFAAIGPFLVASVVTAAVVDLSQRRRFLQATQRAM